MRIRATLALLLLTLCAAVPALFVQGRANAQATSGQAAAPALTEAQRKNIQEYIELLRENLRQEKAEIMGSVMQFNPEEAGKFWPIYSEYDAELTKLNDRRVENLKSYVREYSQMTDEKADQLTKEALDFQRQRAELLAKYYDRVKQALGATVAARFLRVENQLLSLIDLQIDSRLPIHGGPRS